MNVTPYSPEQISPAKHPVNPLLYRNKWPPIPIEQISFNSLINHQEYSLGSFTIKWDQSQSKLMIHGAEQTEPLFESVVNEPICHGRIVVADISESRGFFHLSIDRERTFVGAQIDLWRIGTSNQESEANQQNEVGENSNTLEIGGNLYFSHSKTEIGRWSLIFRLQKMHSSRQ